MEGLTVPLEGRLRALSLVDIFEPLSREADREHQLEAPQH
jgi:hypothetical protein